jgi:TPR repeat protein
MRWYEKAAALGEAVAMRNIGTSFEAGEGVEASKVDAICWYRRAAEQGDAYSMRELERLLQQESAAS